MNSGNNSMTPELYATVMADIPYTMIIANLEGKFIFWNKSAYKLFKKELKESEQDDWVDDWGVYNLDKTTKYATEDIPLSRALRGETVTAEKLYLHTAGRDGLYIKVSAFPIFDEENKIKAGVVVCEDITTEQQLYESIIHKINDLESYLKELVKDNILRKIISNDIKTMDQ